MHALDRILGLLDLALEGVDLGRLAGAGARHRGQPLMLEMDEQLGEAALDGFEMDETAVAGVELLDQLDDAVLEMADHRLVGPRELDLFELVGQSLDHVRQRVGVLAGLVVGVHHIGDCRDPLFEDRQGSLVPS